MPVLRIGDGTVEPPAGVAEQRVQRGELTRIQHGDAPRRRRTDRRQRGQVERERRDGDPRLAPQRFRYRLHPVGAAPGEDEVPSVPGAEMAGAGLADAAMATGDERSWHVENLQVDSVN